MESSGPDVAVFMHGDVWMERWRDRLPAKEETEREGERQKVIERAREEVGGSAAPHAEGCLM